MKASELRIGNIVFNKKIKELEIFFSNKKINKSDKSCSVTGFLAGNVWVKYTYTDQYLNELENEVPASLYDLAPIPLTEEWLVKFGFIRERDSVFSLEYKCRIFFGYWLVDYSMKFGDTFLPNEIRYVHQLQNLYFALTGEELTIKENESIDNP